MNSSYLRIADDPTKWWLDQPGDVSHLTGPTARFEVKAPLAGLLLLSAKAAPSVAAFTLSAAEVMPKVVNLTVPTIYLPGLSPGRRPARAGE